MSKSLGNFFTIRDVLSKFDGETVRFFMLRTHYRSPFNFSDASLEDARQALRRLYTALEGHPPSAHDGGSVLDETHPAVQRFAQAMDEDFNTPLALAVLFDLASDLNRSADADTAALLRRLGGVLGLLQQEAQSYLRSAGSAQAELDVTAIEALIAERTAAKAEKDFARADAVRTQLLAMGIVLKDGPQGTSWVRG